jgi:AhpD family alkylhydroperoxidase
MEKRIKIYEVEPQAFKAMFGLEGYLAKAEISKTLKELIKIRASQINNCAYCIDMHTKDAVKNGENPQRIFLISAWREATQYFTEQEQTVLAMAEEITLVHQKGLSTETYERAAKVFTKNQIAQIIMVIVTINAWNRIAVSTHQEIDAPINI